MLNFFKRLSRPTLPAAGPTAQKMQISGEEWRGLNQGPRSSDLPRTKMGIALGYAFSIPAYRATFLRVRAVGGMRWVIKNTSTSEELDASDHSHHTTRLGQALAWARRTHGHSLFGLWQFSKCVHGMTFIEKTRDIARQPAGLYWLNPLHVSIVSPRGVIEGYDYSGVDRIVRFTKQDVLYDRYVHPTDDTLGMSPMEVAMAMINIDRNVGRFVSAYFRNDARPGQMLSPRAGELSVTDMQAIQQQFGQLKGVDAAFKTFLSPVGLDLSTFDPPDVEKIARLNKDVEAQIFLSFGVPRAIAGDTDSTRYQASNEENNWFYLNTVIPECDDSAECVNLELVPFFEGGRTPYYIEFDTSEYDLVSEDDKARAVVVQTQTAAINDQLRGGIISIAQAQEALGYKADSAFADLYLVNNIPVPKAQLHSVWETQFVAPMPAYGSDLPLSVEPPVTLLPDNPQPAGDTSTATDPIKDTTTFTVMFGLGGQTPLIELQQMLKARFADQQIEWVNAEDYHITLLHIPSITDAQAAALRMGLEMMTIDPIECRIGSLRVFDNLGNYAVHFRVKENPALRELQEDLYDICEAVGIAVSAHSSPPSYIPHITMGYATSKPKGITYHTRLSVTPDSIWLGLGEDVTRRYKLEPDIPLSDCRQDNALSILREHAKALEELQAWRKFVNNHKGIMPRPFVTQALDTEIAGELAKVIGESGGDMSAIKSAFDAAFDAMKSETAYERSLMSAIRGYYTGSLDADAFEDAMFVTIRRYFTIAFTEGLKTEGLRFTEISDNERVQLDNSIQREAGYIMDLRARLDRALKDDVKLNSVLTWARAWSSRYNEMVALGALTAARDKKYEWVWGPTEHCEDCARLNGRVYKASQWLTANVRPRSSRLACFGTHCQCQLLPTDKALTRGAVPKLRGPRKGHTHDTGPDYDVIMSEANDDELRP